MTSEWQKVRLGDVLTQVKRPVEVSELEEVSFAGVRWYTAGVYHRATIASSEVKTKLLHRLELEDIVYNRMWATKASFGLVTAKATGCLVTNDFPIFVSDYTRTLPRFIELVFTTTSFQHQASVAATGTTERRRLNERDFVQLPLLLPPLAEQRRIVDLIGALDDAIEAAEEHTKTADELLEVHLESLRGTALVLLGDLARLRSGPSWKAADESPQPTAGGEPVLSITNTPAGRELNLAVEKYVAGLPSSTMRATDSSLIMIRTNGNRNRIGNVYRARGEIDGYAVSAFQILIEPNVPSMGNHLYWSLSVPSVQRAISEAASGSTGLGNVAVGWLKKLEVPDPTAPEVEGHLNIAESLYEAIHASQTQLCSLRVLRTELLSSLLSGAHTIPQSYDKLILA
ncbi:restriction endonuclease subunit S [Arthrobacter sp. HLT1-21]